MMNFPSPITSGTPGIYGQSIPSTSMLPPTTNLGILNPNTIGANIPGIPSVGLQSVYLNQTSPGGYQISSSILPPTNIGSAGFSQINSSGIGNVPSSITHSFKNPSVIQRNPGENDVEFYQRAFNLKGTILSISEPKVISSQVLNTISQPNPSIKPIISSNAQFAPSASTLSGNREIAVSSESNNYFANQSTSSVLNPPISGTNQGYA